jgi:hypothetical protein
VTKSPVKLSDLFRYYKQLPHQMAAIVELEAALSRRRRLLRSLHRTSLTVKFALMKNAGDSPIKRNVTIQ